MRELRNGKEYETKWFTVGEIGQGDVAVRNSFNIFSRLKTNFRRQQHYYQLTK